MDLSTLKLILMKSTITSFICLLFLNPLFSNENQELIQLWQKMEKKFTIDLKNDFSNKNIKGYLSYFAPNSNINIYQLGKDTSGKNGKGKTIKVFNGNIFCSIFRARIPAKIMAKTLFKRLAKQNYKNSEIQLLAIDYNDGILKGYIRIERYNTMNEKYMSAKGLYTFKNINQEWYITEISTFDDNSLSDNLVDLKNMWYPKKEGIKYDH